MLKLKYGFQIKEGNEIKNTDWNCIYNLYLTGNKLTV